MLKEKKKPAHCKADLLVFYPPPPPLLQYGNVGAMAITLCQSLGQNIGMRWNNARSAAGKAQHSQEAEGEIFRRECGL